MRNSLVAKHMLIASAEPPATREKFSCSSDQFDRIVAFAERHGLLNAPLYFVVSEYKRTKLH